MINILPQIQNSMWFLSFFFSIYSLVLWLYTYLILSMSFLAFAAPYCFLLQIILGIESSNSGVNLFNQNQETNLNYEEQTIEKLSYL